MKFSLNYTGNTKTGNMPVSTSSKATCPDTCGLKEKGCYAKYSFLGSHWNKVTSGERGIEWADFIAAIKKLPSGSLWRHNQAGDLQGNNNVIDHAKLTQLVKANKGKNGFTYTHYPLTTDNIKAIKSAIVAGFTINASADNMVQADNAKALGLPVAVLIHRSAGNVTYTPKGTKIVACPAEKSDSVTCASCKLCAKSDRDFMIGFRGHGTAAKHVDLIAMG